MTMIYALVHLTVDLACAFLIYAFVWGAENWYLWFLVYNFCAFAMQMPLGALADRLNRNSAVAVTGCAGVLAGLAFGAAGVPGAACVAAGMGNACFHVGGGIDVLNGSEGRASALGVFVAPGALGIFLGSMLGKAGSGVALWMGAAMVLCAVAIRLAAGRCHLWNHSENAPVAYEPLSSKQILAVCCLFTVVALRSYSGMVQDFPWKDSLAGSAWLLTGAVVFGKIAGGVLADRIGLSEAAVRSMGAAAAGFIALMYPLTGILAVFCWNMSMPLTLRAVSGIFPGAKGFSFGLLTFALFIGFCLAYLSGGAAGRGGWGAGAFSSPVGMALMSVISIFLLYQGIKKAAV